MFMGFERCMGKAFTVVIMLTFVFSANAFGISAPVYGFDENGYIKTEPETGSLTGKLIVTANTSSNVISTKDGENEFIVIFSIANVPKEGISGYSFSVEYDNDVVEPVMATAEEIAEYDSKVAFKYGDNAAISSLLFNDRDWYGGFFMSEAKGNGIMFTKKFKAKSEGNTRIYIKDIDGEFLLNSRGRNIEAYTQGVDITVKS